MDWLKALIKGDLTTKVNGRLITCLALVGTAYLATNYIPLYSKFKRKPW